MRVPNTEFDPQYAVLTYNLRLQELFPLFKPRFQKVWNLQTAIFDHEPDKIAWMNQSRAQLEAIVRKAYSHLSSFKWPDWPDYYGSLDTDIPDEEWDEEFYFEEVEGRGWDVEEVRQKIRIWNSPATEETLSEVASTEEQLPDISQRVGTNTTTLTGQDAGDIVNTHLGQKNGWSALWAFQGQPTLFDAICIEVGRQVLRSPKLLTLRLPSVAPKPLADLDLSVRSFNCLSNAGFGASIGGLGEKTIGDLMNLRGFGARSLIEVMVALEKASQSLQQVPTSPESNLRELETEEEPEKIGPHNPNIGDLLSRLDDQTLILREAAHEFVALLHGGFEKEKAAQLGQKWREILDHLGPIWLQLEHFGAELPEGGSVAVPRHSGLGKELERWISLLQDYRAARRLNDENCPDELQVLMGSAREKMGEIVGTNLGEWVVHLAEIESDPTHPAQLEETLRALRKELETLCARLLEDELNAIIVAYGPSHPKSCGSDEDLPTRRDEIFRERLGWNGEEAHTLNEIKDHWKVSRERVRQIAKPFEKWLGERTLFTPALDHALALVRENLPGSSDDIAHLLHHSGITRQLWSLKALHDTARSLGQQSGFVVTKWSDEDGETISLAWDGENGQSGKPLPTRVWNLITTHIWERGIGFWPGLESEILEKEGEEALALAHALLELHPTVRWLDREIGWFWLQTARAMRGQENRLLTQITRALSVARRLPLPRLHAAVTRVHLRSQRPGYDWEMPSAEIFAEWCFQQPRFSIEDGMVEMRDTPHWTEVVDNTEATMVDILKQHGPLLSRWKFQRLCAEQGVPKPTFYIYVDGLATIEEVDEGIFTLVGTIVTPEQLDTFRGEYSNFAKRFRLRYGRLDDGRLWMSYHIAQGILNNGTLNIPVRMRGEFAGRFDLATPQGASIGTLSFNSIQCWGLKPFFRSRVAVNDRVTIIVDRTRNQATAFVGLSDLPEAILSQVESLVNQADNLEEDENDIT